MPPNVLQSPDGEGEARHTVSLLSGPPPETLRFAHPHEEARSLAERLRYHLGSGFRPSDVAIFARTRHTLTGRVTRALALAGLEGVHLSDGQPPPNGGVALGTMHRAKGLEFRVVLIVGCEADQLPLAAAARALEDKASKDAFCERERNLFYVACTRAREHLLLTYVGAPSSFLAGS